MDLFKFIIISLHIAKVFSRNSRKKYTSSSSDESIENLLYYKDCQHRRNEPPTTPEPRPPPEPLRQNACPNPRMCCSLSCDNECGGNNMLMARQDSSNMGLPPVVPMPQMQQRQLRMPLQPSMMSRSRGMKRKRLQPTNLVSPIGTRRDFGFTKEKIKSLISKDGDIRKILKDLVRVTMQKVDLVDMLKTRRSGNSNGIGNGIGNENGDENVGGDAVEPYKNEHYEDDYEIDEDDDDDLE